MVALDCSETVAQTSLELEEEVAPEEVELPEEELEPVEDDVDALEPEATH